MPNVITGLLDKMTGAERRKEAAVAAVEKAARTFTSADFMAGVPMPSAGGKSSQAYSNSWVAYSCIKRMATDCAGVPLRVLTDPDDLDSEVSPSHPLAQLMADPSPDFSQSEMIQWLVMWLQLRGEFFLHFDNALAPREMVFWKDPLHWSENLTAGRVASWTYGNGQDRYTLDRTAVLQHRMVNPANPWRGQAPIQAAARALGIDVGAETLQQDVIDRGGERAVIYEFPADITPEQREQALAYLRGRRLGDGTVARDTVLPAGGKVVDPRFTENDLSILDSQKLQPDKICAVYGMSKSLLGIEDIDKYATFQGRRDVYLTNTLIPMIRGIEAAFDRYLRRNMTSRWFGYVRFDISKLEAYAESLQAKFQAAAIAHAAGLPWTVCNERFGLGLELDQVPGADVVLVSAGMVPVEQLINEWENPTPDPVPPVPPMGDPQEDPKAPDTDPEDPGEGIDPEAPKKVLTQELINKRAGDIRANLQRTVRLAKAEQNMRGQWRKAIGEAAKRTKREVLTASTPEGAGAAVARGMAGLADRAAAIAKTHHETAAREGARSIVEIVAGKMGDAELEVWKARAPWHPQVSDFINQRENLIRASIGDLFEDVKATAVKAVTDGIEGDALVSLLASRFESAPGGINRAVTIARTEIGAAYSVSRNAEMTAQGFEKHMWQTAGDERVRDGESPGEFDHSKCDGEVVAVGEAFSCGLPFPMAPGGDAGNVINCRCETIPLMAGMEP